MPDHQPRCVICDGDMIFEALPPTGDGQAEELICLRCGAAEVVTPIVAHLWPAHPGKPRRIAPQQRQAA